MRTTYILDENDKVKECPNRIEFGRWLETADRTVKRESFGPYEVSTVFLGINHNFDDTDHPVLWETMVFNTSDAETRWREVDMDRCSGERVDALLMHEEMAEKIRARAEAETKEAKARGFNPIISMKYEASITSREVQAQEAATAADP